MARLLQLRSICFATSSSSRIIRRMFSSHRRHRRSGARSVESLEVRTLLASAPPLADVVFQRDNGTWLVAASDGSQFTASSWGNWETPGITWVDHVSGDFDGDGLQDVAARNLATGEWHVGLSNGETFVMSNWVRWNPDKQWGQIQVADFNGDGRDDIAGRIQDPGDGRWFVSLSTGSSFTFHQHWYTWNPNVTWGQIATGDFNGDGRADIVGRERSPSSRPCPRMPSSGRGRMATSPGTGPIPMAA